MSGDTPEEIMGWANKVTGQLGGAWSVDFLCDVDGTWWLTDMALAGMSYHWEGCPNENRWRDERFGA